MVRGTYAAYFVVGGVPPPPPPRSWCCPPDDPECVCYILCVGPIVEVLHDLVHIDYIRDEYLVVGGRVVSLYGLEVDLVGTNY